KNKIKDILEKNNKENSNNKDKKLKIGILGARSNENIVKIIEENNCEVIFNITCTGMERNLSIDDNNILDSYIKSVLNQTPCMRMEEANKREEFVRNFEGKVDGIICHTVQFCDNYSYEYADFKQKLDIPILLLETDCTKQCEGQIKTRVEAFLESLAVTKGISIKDNKKMKINKNGDIYVLGVDSGSTSTNAVIMDKNKKIIAHDVIRTGAKSMESAEKVLESVLKKANLKKEDLSLIVSTGYGRVSIVYADESVTEISCHGKGAHYFNPSIRTILDIGGQDSKAIKLNEKGEVIDFVMNDKCAAGTGRFLEMMAKTLEISIGELGPISFNSKENIEITSLCSVFAESEVISLIAQNKEKSDIANGVHNAIASKSYSLLKRVGFEKVFMLTGGVAKNPGVVKAVEDKIGSKLYICEEPEIVGATGAALYALEKILN
ncbi:MAG: 2-hydroxyacyl-CoA dehydratase, partial [Bacilli bacterium]|nr:2-hydroxyacyl-CoA dehydratase [Bacilli bacterium]